MDIEIDNPAFEPDDDDTPDVQEDSDITPLLSPPGASQTSRETSTTTNQPGTSTPRLKQQVLKNKIDALHHHLGAKGNIDLIDYDRFKMKTSSKTGFTDLLWYNGENWVSLTNQRTGEFLAASTLKSKFGGLAVMENILNLEETPPSLDRSIKAASKQKSELPTTSKIEEIPLEDLSSIVEEIHIKTREASQNTDLEYARIFRY